MPVRLPPGSGFSPPSRVEAVSAESPTRRLRCRVGVQPVKSGDPDAKDRHHVADDRSLTKAGAVVRPERCKWHQGRPEPHRVCAQRGVVVRRPVPALPDRPSARPIRLPSNRSIHGGICASATSLTGIRNTSTGEIVHLMKIAARLLRGMQFVRSLSSRAGRPRIGLGANTVGMGYIG